MRKSLLIAGLILLLVLAATAAGIFYHTEGARIDHVTVRGDPAVFQGSGLYRYDPVPLAREAIIWDVVNLLIGLPLFAVGIFLSGRNSLRGRLLLAGLLSYFFYVYLMYATMMAFNPLFLLYVAVFALSTVAFVLNLTGIDVAHLPQRVGARFPRRLVVGYMVVLAAIPTMLWLGRIIPMTIANRFPAELAGQSTLEPQALDLGFVVPLSLAGAFLLWRRSSWGYLLAGIGITHGSMMFLVIPTWIVVPLIQGGTLNLIEAIPFMALSLFGILLAVWFYKSVRGEAGPDAA